VRRVLFIVVILRSGSKLFWDGFQGSIANGINTFLIVGVAVPDHDEVRIETDADGNPADVISWDSD